MTTLYPPNPLSVDGSIVSISSLAEHFYNVRAALTDSPSSSASAYSLGGFHIRIQFGSELLREQISPAIDHLCDERDSETALTVFLHDHFSAPAAGSLVSSRNYSTDETETWLMDDSDVTLILQQQGRLVSLLDWGRNAAHWLISDATSIPYLERAEPLRAILSYWLARRERYLIHGAAVGNSNGGVLIIGHGGAGKSTTALACLDAGLEYVGDDHCLLSREGTPSVHSICGTAKLAVSDLNRFPSLVSAAETNGRPVDEKMVLFLARLPGSRLSRSFPLRAILLLRIADSRRSRLHRVGEAEGFKALAPSCALHFPATRSQALRCFSSVSRKLPTYILELGSEIDSGPRVIRELLDRHAN